MPNRLNRYLQGGLLLLVFGLSVVARLPLLDGGKHASHAGNVFMLTTLEIWEVAGPGQHRYSPVLTWPNSGDRYMHDYKRLEDGCGNNYYVSHPPFPYHLAYAVFCLFERPPSLSGLKTMGLMLHLLSAFLIYLIIRSLSRNRWAAILGFSASCFYPVVANGFAFHFFSEMVGIPLWLLGGYLVLRLLNGARNHFLWLFGITNFLFVYTDWTGLLFTASLSLFFIFTRRRRLFLVASLSGVGGLVLIVIQYGSIAGLDAFLNAIGIRFIERSGHFGNALSDRSLGFWNPETYSRLLGQFHHQLKWTGYAFLAVLSWLMVRKFIEQKDSPPFGQGSFGRLSSSAVGPTRWVLPVAFLLPALLRLTIFLNANALHYVYQAKYAVLIAIWSGLIFSKFHTRANQWLCTGILGLGMLGSVILFRTDGPQDPWPEAHAIADHINRSASENEHIYYHSGKSISTMYLSYLSKRSVVNIHETTEVHRPAVVIEPTPDGSFRSRRIP